MLNFIVVWYGKIEGVTKSLELPLQETSILIQHNMGYYPARDSSTRGRVDAAKS